MEPITVSFVADSLESDENGSDICQSKEAAPITKQKAHETASNTLMRLALDALAGNNYDKAFNLFKKCVSEDPFAAINHNDIVECCKGVMALQIATLTSNMSKSAANSFFEKLIETTTFLENINEKEFANEFKNASYNVLYMHLFKIIHSYQNINLNKYSFNELREQALAYEYVIKRLLNIGLDDISRKNYLELGIYAFQFLLQNNGEDIVKNKWGNFNYVSWLNQSEIQSLIEKKSHFIKLMEENQDEHS